AAFGSVGVRGETYKTSAPTAIAVQAVAALTTQTALSVSGKAHFSRSGRSAIAAGKSSLKVTLAGTTASSKVFAVLATSATGRFVRAVVPASGSFTVYLNTTVAAKSYLSWFVLD
ncbi:MAG TPA: hypothetical protein VIH37_01505, partial [Candidatus Limnocylindrales bacterium]